MAVCADRKWLVAPSDNPQPVERADVTEFCDFETQAGLGPGRPAIQCLRVTRSFHVCDVTTSLKRAADRRSLRVSVSPPGKYAALLHTTLKKYPEFITGNIVWTICVRTRPPSLLGLQKLHSVPKLIDAAAFMSKRLAHLLICESRQESLRGLTCPHSSVLSFSLHFKTAAVTWKFTTKPENVIMKTLILVLCQYTAIYVVWDMILIRKGCERLVRN